MPESSYHRRQAEALIRLAESTTDQGTARPLMMLAAEHTALAEAEAVRQQSPDSA
jgi:hypothetical protein